jgi:periplasmic protein TonB
MPAYAEHRQITRPRERAFALAAVVVVQLAIGFALLTGLRVPVSRSAEVVQQLISIALPRTPPPVPPPTVRTEPKPQHKRAAAPKAEPAPPGGSPGPRPAHAPPSVAPIVAVRPTAPPSGGGTGTGPALGSGSGGGAGGTGYGDTGGGRGTELEQIAGEITPRDYPRRLGNAGVGGRVGLLFTVGVNGRVTRCVVTRSSGVPELDALTCRLIMQRFLFRPGTDRYGRPVSDEVEGEHIWESR